MKSWAAVLSTAALLCAGPVAAQNADHAPANQADLQCMALVAVLAGLAMEEGTEQEDHATRMAGLSGGMMYYLGRLQGRSPDIDWLSELSLFLGKAEFSDLDAVAPRCGKELSETGEALIAFGGKSPPVAAD